MRSIHSIHPVLVHEHVEVEEDLLIQGDFEFAAGGAADALDPLGVLADEHALVAFVGGEDDGLDVDEWLALLVLAVLHQLDLHGGGIGNLLAGLEVNLFANDFGDPELVGGVGDLAGGVLRGANGQKSEDGLNDQLDILLFQRGDFDDRGVLAGVVAAVSAAPGAFAAGTTAVAGRAAATTAPALSSHDSR